MKRLRLIGRLSLVMVIYTESLCIENYNLILNLSVDFHNFVNLIIKVIPHKFYYQTFNILQILLSNFFIFMHFINMLTAKQHKKSFF